MWGEMNSFNVFGFKDDDKGNDFPAHLCVTLT
jgi:hypothetical protein